MAKSPKYKHGDRTRRRLKLKGLGSYKERLKAQAENRRKLFESLPPATADFARREFAKLGLY